MDNKISFISGFVFTALSTITIMGEADSEKTTPQSIKDDRAALRTQSDLIEAEINALTTKKDVVLFDINI